MLHEKMSPPTNDEVVGGVFFNREVVPEFVNGNSPEQEKMLTLYMKLVKMDLEAKLLATRANFSQTLQYWWLNTDAIPFLQQFSQLKKLRCGFFHDVETGQLVRLNGWGQLELQALITETLKNITTLLPKLQAEQKKERQAMFLIDFEENHSQGVALFAETLQLYWKEAVVHMDVAKFAWLLFALQAKSETVFRHEETHQVTKQLEKLELLRQHCLTWQEALSHSQHAAQITPCQIETLRQEIEQLLVQHYQVKPAVIKKISRFYAKILTLQALLPYDFL